MGPRCSMVLSWTTASSVYNFSVLRGCPFPGPLAVESMLFLGKNAFHAFLCLPIGIPGLLASLTPRLGYMWQKIQESHCRVHF